MSKKTVKIIGYSTAGVFLLLILFFIYVKAEIEGNFDSCKFTSPAEALIVAERKWRYIVKNNPEYQKQEFEAIVDHVGPSPAGGYSAVVFFTSTTEPKISFRLWFMDDCTQAGSVER